MSISKVVNLDKQRFETVYYNLVIVKFTQRLFIWHLCHVLLCHQQMRYSEYQVGLTEIPFILKKTSCGHHIPEERCYRPQRIVINCWNGHRCNVLVEALNISQQGL